MSSEEKRRCAAFITASLLLHAAALAWLDLTGADVGRLPSKLTVLLESRGEDDGSEAAEPPASATRSRDLFRRPPLRVTRTAPPASAAPLSAMAEAPSRVAPSEADKPELRTKAKTPATTPQPKPEREKKSAHASPAATAAAVSAPAEIDAAEDASPEASAATVAAARHEPAPAAADSGAAERQGQLLSLLHQAISREKRYPLLAKRQRREGTTTVIFSMSPSGELDAIVVDRSSGYSLLDTAAVSAVSRVAPFGPARLFLTDVTRFKVNVTFKLN